MTITQNILTLYLLNQRLDKMIQFHNELFTEADEKLDENETENIIYIKNAAFILIKLYLCKLCKNQARYGEVKPQSSHIYTLADEEVYFAFHEFQSEKVLDEIQLSPQLEQKYDQDIFRLLNIRGKVTPFINPNENPQDFEIFMEDIALILKKIFKNNKDILTQVLNDDFRTNHLDKVIKRAFIEVYQTNKLHKKANKIVEAILASL